MNTLIKSFSALVFIITLTNCGKVDPKKNGTSELSAETTKKSSLTDNTFERMNLDPTAHSEIIQSWGTSRPDKDSFGKSISIFGDRLVMSCPDCKLGSGQAWVFKRKGNKWEFEMDLVEVLRNHLQTQINNVCSINPLLWNQNEANNELVSLRKFGHKVHIGENGIFISAPQTNHQASLVSSNINCTSPVDDGIVRPATGLYNGVVYYFKLNTNSSNWYLSNKYTSNLTTNLVKNFGDDFAISGNNIAITNGRPNPGQDDSTKIHVNVYNISNSTFKPVITNSNSLSRHKLSLVGNFLAVGVPDEAQSACGLTCGIIYSGRVFIYKFDGSNYNLFQSPYIASTDTNRSFAFGTEVKLIGDLLFVSDPGYNNNFGSVSLYQYKSQSGLYEFKQMLNGPKSNIEFGKSFEVQNSIIYVTAPKDRKEQIYNEATNTRFGSVLVYVLGSNNVIHFKGTLKSEDESNIKGYGGAISIHGNYLAISDSNAKSFLPNFIYTGLAQVVDIRYFNERLLDKTDEEI